MITQSKLSTGTNFRTLLDIILVCSGVLIGGVVAFISVWLWLDYQADPSRSVMALISTNLVTVLPNTLRGYLGNQAQVMGLPFTGQTSAYWYMARAGGIVGYLLLWFSVIWGLTLTTKIVTGLVPAPLAYGLHEFLSILTIVFAAVHGLVLLGDNYINFSLVNVAVPFTAPYRPLWTGLGITGFYLSAALTTSFYIRKQIGQKVWRAIHYLTFGAYTLVLIHGLMAGTDTPVPVIKLMYLGTGASVLFLTYYRLFTLKTANH